MESEKKNQIMKYLIVGGALACSYYVLNYFSNLKKAKAKPITLDKTKKILREVKYQMLTTCFTYAEAVSNKQRGRMSEEDLEIAFRTELAKVCEANENRILNKYELSHDQYSASLEEYKKNPRIQQEQAQIIDMMERSIKGRYPDLTVPPQASQLAARLDLVTVYLEMCQQISIKIWQKLHEHKQKNPGFNSKDDLHYKKAMRQLNIYDVRNDFLEQKGFLQAWGSPVEVYVKILEAYKLKQKKAKEETNKIEKAFDKTLEGIMNEPQNFNAERIKFFLEENISHAASVLGDVMKSQGKNQVQPQPQPQRPPPAVTKSLNNPSKKKQEQEFSMDNLMMQQLLSRSAEQPKEEPKSEPIQQKEPKVEKKEEPKPEPVQKAQQAQKPEQIKPVEESKEVVENQKQAETKAQIEPEKKEEKVEEVKPEEKQQKIEEPEVKPVQSQEEKPQEPEKAEEKAPQEPKEDKKEEVQEPKEAQSQPESKEQSQKVQVLQESK